MSFGVTCCCRLLGRSAFVFLGWAAISASAQNESPTASHSPELSLVPKEQPSPSVSPPESPDQAIKIAKETALEAAASKVVSRIQDEEQDLYHRLSYLQKPERLDPNSFSSIDEIGPWKKSLQDLKEKGEQVAHLYASVGQDLEAELRDARIEPPLLAQFKGFVLEGFPWNDINRKNQLLKEFVEQHVKLLAFYEKNFGAWKKGEANKPVFDSPQLTAAYKKMRTEILATGEKLEKEYRTISE
jgi:hypothetical protein